MTSKTSRVPDLTGREAQDVGAERASRRRANFDVLFLRLAERAPGLLTVKGAGPILADLAAAELPGEWNSAVARLVQWALSHAVPPDRRRAREFRIAIGQLRFLIAQGFVSTGQAEAAEPAAQRQDDFKQMLRDLLPTAPELAGPHAAEPMLSDAAAAGRLDEWNSAVARLVQWALSHAVPPDRRRPPEFSEAIGQLRTLIAQGFVGAAHRRRNSKSLEHDADIIRLAGARTPAEAVAAIDAWDRASLLPGQQIAEEIAFGSPRKDRLRKRALRAAAHAGIVLETRRKKARSAP